MIATFVNPRSRANLRDPGLVARFADALNGQGRVIAATSLEALAAEARALAASPPRAIAVHGGDGTLHITLTALLRAFDGKPLPPVAVLSGGTMNVVVSSLGIKVPPVRFLADLAAQVRAGGQIPTLHRRCMQVGDRFGFVFGNGMLANFLVEYYDRGGYGVPRALWLLTRLFFSALVRGPLVRRVFRRFRGRVAVDGTPLPRTDFTGLGAATVREVGMGFKLNHRADDDPDRFAVLAIHAGPLSLAPDLLAVRTGRGIAPSRAYSVVASSLEIEPAEPGSPYTVDGDLYRTDGPLRIMRGPLLEIVDPRRGRPVPELPGPAPGATIDPRP